ncbi:MAG: hypothetical protein WED04_12535 [Promethearchaeati archaeon SRVP18_Atabeyarchaeia-1]
MTEILYSPIRQIHIMEVVQFESKEELASIAAVLFRIGQPSLLSWAEGVVFTGVPLAPTSATIFKEMIQGRSYWLSISFALMPEFKEKISVGTIDIPVIDMSRSIVARKVAGFLRKWKPDKTEE